MYAAVGFSESSAELLAGLYHVVEDRDRFEDRAQAFLRGRIGPPTKI